MKVKFELEFVLLHMPIITNYTARGWECECMHGNMTNQHFRSHIGLHHRRRSWVGRLETVHLLKHGQELKLCDQSV